MTGNLVSGIVPVVSCDAFNAVILAPRPLKDVAVISVALIVPTIISGVPAKLNEVLAKPEVLADPTTLPINVDAVRIPLKVPSRALIFPSSSSGSDNP